MPITSNNEYITTSSLTQYQTKKIKRTFDTKISEFSSDGAYDYMPGPELVVISPNGGEFVWSGDVINIQWNSEEASLMPEVDVYIMDGNKVISAYRTNNLTSSSFDCVIPAGALPSENMKIFITGSFEDVSFFDYSDNTFTLDKRSIIIDGFNSPRIYANQSNQFHISWKSKGVSDIVKIEVLNELEDSVIFLLEDNYVVPTNEYTWTVNNINRGTGTTKLKVTSIDHSTVYGTSEKIILLTPYIEKMSISALSKFNPKLVLNDINISDSYNPYIHITNFQII